MTTDQRLLAGFSLTPPADPEGELTNAEARLKMAVAAREQMEGRKADAVAVEQADSESQGYLRRRVDELTASVQSREQDAQSEILAMHDTCDAAAHAESITSEHRTLNLYTRTWQALTERLAPLHRLQTAEVRASLAHSRASEAEALAVVSYLRGVIALGPAIKEEGQVSFVGRRTADLWALCLELRGLAAVTDENYRQMRRDYESQQRALDAHGMVTRTNVASAIGGR